MKTGAGYLRVSTDEQKETGHGLDRQRRGIEAWAAEHGVSIVAWFQDDCSGTIEMGERPQGREMIAHLKRGGVDLVIADTVCRITRPKFDEAEFIVLRYEFERRYKAQIVTCDMPSTGDRFADNIIGLAKSKGAKEEREKILKRTMAGKDDKAKSRWVGSYEPPYGYRRVGLKHEARLEIMPDKADVVRRIFAMYTRGLTLADIAKTLTNEPIEPPNTRMARGTVGRGWYRETVRLILKRTTYIGQLAYNGQVAHLPELAIIDQATFDAAQKRMLSNSAQARRNRQNQYLIAGHIRCTCGGAMSGTYHAKRNGDKVLTYKCNRRHDYGHLVDCAEPSLLASQADPVVWDWLAGLLREPDRLNAGLLEYADMQHGRLEDKHARLDTLADLIAKGERQVKRLAGDLSDYDGEDDGEDDGRNAIKAEMQAASKRLKAYRAERDEINANLANVVMTDERRALILEWAAEINQGINDGDVSFEVKRQLLNWLEMTAKIEYRNGQRGLLVKCILPYAEKWLAVEVVKSTCSQTCHNRDAIQITTWLPLDNSLAAQWLATAGVTAQVVTA